MRIARVGLQLIILQKAESMEVKCDSLKTNPSQEKNTSRGDPSFKSKRYRDKLRTEVKALEDLLPIDRPSLHRKLDSQTVYRLVIAFLRVKLFLAKCDQQVGSTLNKELSRDMDKGSESVMGAHENEKLLMNTSETGVGCPKDSLHASSDVHTDVRPIDSQTEYENRTSVSRKNYTVSTPGSCGTSKQVDGCGTLYNGVFGEKSDANLGTDVSDMFDQETLNQVLDGFVLAATVDGLVMFVTTNVTDFTGYHQTDLLHRCMYGIVHPDDRASLRHQLEDTRTYKQYNSSSNETGSEDQKVAFLCRMKCYHGNSTGHVKFHCSGKILRSTHLPKTVKSSNRVLLLLCRPFVPSVGVAGYEDGDLIMWSKHDLGLQFEDCEQRLHTCLGYSMDEMTSRSLYQLVHPEDIHLLAHAHSLMMIGGGVQQVFLRLVRADGGCVWATTKGKAVSRNSKKFSVVFTHSPMGEDVGDFINQEEVRRRYELVNRTITTQHTQGNPEQYHAAQGMYGFQQHAVEEASKYVGCDFVENMNKINRSSFAHEHHCFKNSSCPSTWHTIPGRHSPLVPSNLNHSRLSNRDKARSSVDKETRTSEGSEMGCFPESSTLCEGYRHACSSDDFANDNHKGYPGRQSVHSCPTNFYRPSYVYPEQTNGHLGCQSYYYPNRIVTSIHPYAGIPCYTETRGPMIARSSVAVQGCLNGANSQCCSNFCRRQWRPYNDMQFTNYSNECQPNIYSESFGNAHEAMSNIGGTKYPGNGRTPGIRYHVVCSDSERVRNSLQDTDMHEHGGHYKRIKHEADNSRDAEMYGMCSSVRKHQCSTTFNPPRSRSYDIEASIHMRVVENEHSDVANVFIPDFDNFGMQFS